MFKKFFILNANKNTAIHNVYEDANLGKSFVLPMIHSHLTPSVNPPYSRILLDFNFSDILDYFGDSITSNSFTATLFLTQLKYDEFEHSMDFNIDLFPLTGSWVGGYNASEFFDEDGYANWNYKSNGQLWDVPGGDFVSTSLTSTTHLEDGYEDVKFDVTEYVDAYIKTKLGLTGAPAEFSTTSDFRGFLLKFNKEGLSSFSEYKRFYSAYTHTIYNPKILITIDNGVYEYDNRQRFIFGKQQNLYFPYKIDGTLQSVDISNIVFSVKRDESTITSITASLSVSNGLIKSSFIIPQSEFSATSSYYDVWSISGGNSITGKFFAVTESDVVGLDMVSLTGNLNKNYVSHNPITKVGVASSYNSIMYYDSIQYMKFFPYIKNKRGVDNIGLIFNNELIFPEELYVKFIDAESNYDWTDWIRLDLIGDAYIIEINTKSFRVGAKMRPIFKIKLWDSYNIIMGTVNDEFKISRKI